ncbi:MAG: transglutaminase domain-containing protein [Lachnospiraceae bacterium]
MKKFAGILLLIIGFGGCLMSREATQDTILKDELLVSESSLPDTDGVLPQADGASSEAAGKQEGMAAAEALSREKKADLLRAQQPFYAFSTLQVTEQNLYVEMLYALTNYVEEMEVSTMDTEEIDRIFQCVMLDHPEIFYADGYSFVKYTLGEKVKKITFSGTYVYDQQEKAKREALIEEQVEEILEQIPAEASDYEKVKFVYEWVINHTEYDRGASDNQNICSVLLNGRSVCQGYAKTAQFLLQRLNIPAALVIGTVDNSQGHAWNLVRVDNAYYYVDTTWGDASYLFEQEGTGRKAHVPEINYDYLCITTEELLRTHSFSDLVPLPDCRAMEANYYVQEGAWFTETDWQQLKTLVDRYQQEGRETLTLKCRTEEVYNEMLNQLLEEQRIFDYLKPEGDSILYTDSAKQLSITFWM